MTQHLEQILEQSFLDYSAYVIQRRAIPDARDMFKFSARQILHAQDKDKLTCDKPFKKSQKSVAAATSFSYVHGDTSCYEQIIRMGRPLVQRYFFEEINGNGGTAINSNDYAAPRYTEARVSKLGKQLFEMIGMNTLDQSDWEATYDDEGVFPKVLPSVGYYNICNGSFGSIAPTMVSSVPQFNIRDINAAIAALIGDPTTHIELYPDFASGGILLNPRTTLSSLAAGSGKSALLRGRVAHSKDYLTVTELPYGVYTNTVCTELQKAVDSGKSPVDRFKDLSGRKVNIRIYGKDLQEVEKWLYKNTSVQRHFTIKMIMLDKGKTPKLFNIRSALLAHIEHVKSVYRKATEYELAQLKLRAEILEGLIRAFSIVDEIIKMIKASSGRAEAILHLIAEDRPFKFTRAQAEAIVDLRLHRLSNMDIAKLQEELSANRLNQEKLNELLVNAQRFNEALMWTYEKTAREFGDKRRTEIYTGVEFETAQEGTPMTEKFYLRFSPVGYAVSTNLEDFAGEGVKVPQEINPTDEIIIITNQGRGFLRQPGDFAAGELQMWSDILKLNPDENIIIATTKSHIETVQNVQFTLSNNITKTLHNSFVLLGASKRGKKLLPGKVEVISVNASTPS